MTEEIRETIRELIRAERASGVRDGELDDRWMMESDVDCVLKRLHSQGVVLKVERELPKKIAGEANPTYCAGWYDAQQAMSNYVAVESLIKEE